MDSNWERVINYIDIDRKIAQMMMSPVKKGLKVENLSLIRKGLRNSNYIIDSGKKRFLLRIYGANDNWWKKEKAVYEYIKDKARVPKLIYFNSDFDIIGKPFAVFEYIEGNTLDEYVHKSEDCSEIMYEIGTGLANIHKISYNEVGFLDNDLRVDERLPELKIWYDLFLTERTKRKLGERLSGEVRKYIEGNDRNIRRIEDNIAFVHNDFRPINIIIGGEGRPYFIDWEGSMAGHIFGDIGQFLRFEEQITPENERMFIKGYNETSEYRLPDDYKELGKLRDLVNIIQMLDSDSNLENKDRDLINIIRNSCSKNFNL